MYVLARRDLSETYRLVQAMHALAQYAIEYPKEFHLWNNTTITVLGVRNLIELKIWHMELLKKEKIFSSFYEPDLDGQVTAIACYDDGRIFKDLRLA
jgi:hypothetical protein